MLKFREGWQGEHLARFIISKFAFIAEPSTVADDIGTDFYCTNFDIEIVDKQKYLLPKSSFAIQIKKKKKKNDIDVTNKLRFLDRLEVPYFVGLITTEKECNKIEIYSGEFIPIFLSEIDFTKDRVYLAPCETRTELMWSLKPDDYRILMPKILELSIDCEFKDKNSFVVLEDFYSTISTILKNLSAKKSGEFIFERRDKTSYIIAGTGSAQVYKANFIKRLTEAFFNIQWIFQKRNSDFNKNEYETLKRIFDLTSTLDLNTNDHVLFLMLKSIYNKCRSIIDGHNE